MSEQAPERAPQRGQAPPGKKENVLTRKLGPLPTWVWIVIVAAIILLYFVVKGRSSSSTTGQQQGQQGGFGGFLQPLVIFRRGGRGGGGGGGGDKDRPPHTRHHHRRGDHDDNDDRDKSLKDLDLNIGPNRGAPDPRRGDGRTRDMMQDATVGVDRRVRRGEPVPGLLVNFKTAEKGQTPSLQDVANHYETTPDAIVVEAEGRGAPASVAWKRYVARRDWSSPLPPATDLSILAHPS